MSFSHGWVLRLLRQSNAAQIAGNDSQAQPALHPVLPVVAAFAPAKVPPQAGNAALDTRTPAIAPFPRTCPFQGFAFLRQLARSWDGHPLDSRGFELVLRFWRMHPPITCDQARRMVKERAVMAHRLDGLPMLVGMLQDLIACHDAALHFIKDHLATKLDQRPAFMAGNGTRMGLKDPRALSARRPLSGLRALGYA